jgi:acyl carrier protein
MTFNVNDLIEKLKQACPDIDEMKFAGDTSFKKVALDSMDIASFMLELEESYGIKIPNADISKLDSIDQVITYLNNRLAEK